MRKCAQRIISPLPGWQWAGCWGKPKYNPAAPLSPVLLCTLPQNNISIKKGGKPDAVTHVFRGFWDHTRPRSAVDMGTGYVATSRKNPEIAGFYLALWPGGGYNQRVNGVAWGGRLTLQSMGSVVFLG